jgi:hypothetical protein
MAKRFKKGDELYLMVKVYDTGTTDGYDYIVEWKDVVDGMVCYASVGQVQLVSNADFGTSGGTDWQSKYDECSEAANRRITELEAECERYRQRNIALRRTVDSLTASEDKNTHRAMLMDALIEILLEKIGEMRKKSNG